MTGTLLVFLKYPEPGRVKTRLARAVGPERAATIYRELVGAVFALVQPLRPGVRVVGYFDGAPESAFAEWHPFAEAWWPQPPGDLGVRFEAGFRAAARDGPVVAVGTDSPELDAELIAGGFRLLAVNDAVFGPAHDGGYYLVGSARHLVGFFDGIPWSSETTLAAHLERCQQNGWSVGFLPPQHDIDTHDDWLAYRRRKGLPEDGTDTG